MRRLLSSLVVAFGIVALPALPVGAFSPDRTTYTCASTTSCPGTDQVTFNSFTNNPNYGDERNFFRAKNADSSNPGFTAGAVSIDGGNAVLIQDFVHNDANPAGANATAHDTRVTFTLPTAAATSQTVTSDITASNASPQTVSDSGTFTASQPFTLEFDSASAVNVTQRTNNGKGDFAITPASNVSINGNVMTVSFGDWTGGFANHGLVTIRANVVYAAPAPAPAQTSATLVCSNMSVSPTDSTHATVTTTSGVKDANVSSYAYTLKNSSGATIDTLTTSSNVYNFNQSTPGTYTLSTIINTDKGSTPATNDCTRQITVSAQPVTLSAKTTTTPTTLPNTGPADVAGVFMGTSALGGVGHYLLRRYKR